MFLTSTEPVNQHFYPSNQQHQLSISFLLSLLPLIGFFLLSYETLFASYILYCFQLTITISTSKEVDVMFSFNKLSQSWVFTEKKRKVLKKLHINLYKKQVEQLISHISLSHHRHHDHHHRPLPKFHFLHVLSIRLFSSLLRPTTTITIRKFFFSFQQNQSK